jgi:hypothetical protein
MRRIVLVLIVLAAVPVRSQAPAAREGHVLGVATLYEWSKEDDPRAFQYYVEGAVDSFLALYATLPDDDATRRSYLGSAHFPPDFRPLQVLDACNARWTHREIADIVKKTLDENEEERHGMAAVSAIQASFEAACFREELTKHK